MAEKQTNLLMLLGKLVGCEFGGSVGGSLVGVSGVGGDLGGRVIECCLSSLRGFVLVPAGQRLEVTFSKYCGRGFLHKHDYCYVHAHELEGKQSINMTFP